MSETWDPEDRAIAKALDAAPAAETAGADERLVDEYREVLGYMPVEEMTPAAGLEDRMVAAALDRRPARAAATATVTDLDRARARRRIRVRAVTLVAATVAAAVVIGLIVRTGHDGSPAPGGRLTLTTLHRADVDAVLKAPGTRTGDFGAAFGRVAVATDGRGVLYELQGSAPVSFGLVSSGGTTVVGPARPTGGSVGFVVDHPERVAAVTLLRNGVQIARAELTPS